MEQLQKINMIPSCDLLVFMKEKVVPYLNSIRTGFQLTSKDGLPINGMIYTIEDAKGTIVISHGFTESVQKYDELIYYFVQAGYNVCIHDHKYHGYSRVEVTSKATHIEAFQDYVDDLEVVVNQVVSNMPKPYILFAHSMGGCIGANYIEQHPNIFSKAIFSSPLFEVNRGGIPYPVAKAVASILCLIGKGEAFLPGQGKFSSIEDFENSASNCRERYLYYYQKQVQDPFLQNNGSSCRWALEVFKACERIQKNCAKIDIPVLLFQADKDDFVLPGGQELFLAKIKNGKKVFLPNTKHEIYLSDDKTLTQYLSHIFDFLKG